MNLFLDDNSTLAHDLCKKITAEVMGELMVETEVRMDPDSRALLNLWDEIVVQNAFQHGVGWDLTEQYVEDLILAKVRALKQEEQEFIWLQTDSGIDWELDGEDERGEPAIDFQEIVRYILHEYLYRLADQHASSDERLSEYIERLTS